VAPSINDRAHYGFLRPHSNAPAYHPEANDDRSTDKRHCRKARHDHGWNHHPDAGMIEYLTKAERRDGGPTIASAYSMGTSGGTTTEDLPKGQARSEKSAYRAPMNAAPPSRCKISEEAPAPRGSRGFQNWPRATNNTRMDNSASATNCPKDKAAPTASGPMTAPVVSIAS
jgi:hypothetical protein